MPEEEPTPAATEVRFRNLMHEVTTGGTPCAGVLHIHSFLRPLLTKNVCIDPWVPEVLEALLALIPQSSFIGVDPAVLVELTHQIAVAGTRRPEVRTLPGYDDSIAILRKAAALQFAFVGEPASAFQQLLDSEAVAPHPEFPDALTGGVLLDAYKRILANSTAADQLPADGWKGLLDQWEALISGSRGGVAVPVVEFRPGVSQGQWAGLRMIRYESFGRSTDGSDHIQASVTVVGVHDTVVSTFTPAIAAARSHAIASRGLDPTGFRVRCRIQFDGDQGLHSGRSANLGLATLAACHFTDLLDRRETYRVQPGVAMTGDIDAAGAVLPVDSAALRAKVAAVFHSWISTFVVPASQLAAAQETVQVLRERYPRRHLHILPAKSLQDVFYDRRLTLYTHIGPIRHLVRKAWKQKRIIVVAIILVLLAAIGRLLYGPLDKHPATWSIEGENIVVRNRIGEVLDRIAVGSETALQADEGGKADVGRQLATLADVDKDGIKELIWAESSDIDSNGPSSVSCKKPGADTLLWTIEAYRPFVRKFTGRPLTGSFQWFHVTAGDHDADGRTEVYFLGTSSGFLSLLLKLDGLTGQEEGAYVHAGHLSDLKAVDLNNDGTRELLLCGVNNSHLAACLVVLRPEDITGYSPHTSVYGLDSVRDAHEHAYLLIPRTIVGEVFRMQVKYNIARYIKVHKRERQFSIVLEDAFVNAQAMEEDVSSTIEARFDHDLRLVDVSTGDDFDSLYEDLRGRGKVPDVERELYIVRYEQLVLGSPWLRSPGAAATTSRGEQIPNEPPSR